MMVHESLLTDAEERLDRVVEAWRLHTRRVVIGVACVALLTGIVLGIVIEKLV